MRSFTLITLLLLAHIANSAEKLTQAIEKGLITKEFLNTLTDDEIAAVINYVRQSFGNDLPLISSDLVKKVRAKTEGRRDFYMVEDIMKEHPIPGWEKWKQGATKVQAFE